jgi:hypothetical protein
MAKELVAPIEFLQMVAIELDRHCPEHLIRFCGDKFREKGIIPTESRAIPIEELGDIVLSAGIFYTVLEYADIYESDVYRRLNEIGKDAIWEDDKKMMMRYFQLVRQYLGEEVWQRCVKKVGAISRPKQPQLTYLEELLGD